MNAPSKIRRQLLKIGSSAVAYAALPQSIRLALANSDVNANKEKSLKDVEHVVIFMQENRSFDNYFGTLDGVRGFGDPHPAPTPSGKSVWYQPIRPKDLQLKDSKGTNLKYVIPYKFNFDGASRFQAVDLDHTWRGPQETWKNWDVWYQEKHMHESVFQEARTMGYLTRRELPYYYALANTFTICDGYHCSIFGPTNPNRRFLWTGTSGAGKSEAQINPYSNPIVYAAASLNNGASSYATLNDEIWTHDTSYNADYSDKSTTPGWSWKTYPEVLEENHVSWRVYQGYDNYGDNALQYFEKFRHPKLDDKGNFKDKIVEKARKYSGNRGDDADKSMEALLSDFSNDCMNNTLPAVSWIIAPSKYCEHPENKSSDGEYFTSRVISALAKNKDVWNKSVLFITYDENDGEFDHVPAPIPPISSLYGKSNFLESAQDYSEEKEGDQPLGLGPRVPMIVVSPWSIGGNVSSTLCDHTSVIRFLENWLISKGKDPEKVRCENISKWRRMVCGDLTETLIFNAPESKLVDKYHAMELAKQVDEKNKNYTTYPMLASESFIPVLDKEKPMKKIPGPYSVNATNIETNTANPIKIKLENLSKNIGATFIIYFNSGTENQIPMHYSLKNDSSMTVDLPKNVLKGRVAVVYGPGGFYKEIAQT